MNFISHILWLLILHPPVCLQASNPVNVSRPDTPDQLRNRKPLTRRSAATAKIEVNDGIKWECFHYHFPSHFFKRFLHGPVEPKHTLTYSDDTIFSNSSMICKRIDRTSTTSNRRNTEPYNHETYSATKHKRKHRTSTTTNPRPECTGRCIRIRKTSATTAPTTTTTSSTTAPPTTTTSSTTARPYTQVYLPTTTKKRSIWKKIVSYIHYID